MNIETYTVTLNRDEMFDIAYALESDISSDLTFTDDKKNDYMLNEQEHVLELLQRFVSDFGYRLTVSEKTVEGYIVFDTEAEVYRDAEEWFKALLKQRRKEFDAKK